MKKEKKPFLHCPYCLGTKPREVFFESDKWTGLCDECRKIPEAVKIHKRKLSRKVSRFSNFTVEDYLKLKEDSDGACQICGDRFTPYLRECIDHCHLTNIVRGLICSHCNSAIGYLRDSSERAYKVAEFLKARGH
jgi:hypothetical protein